MFVKVKLDQVDELCRPSCGRLGPCFVVFAKQLKGNRAEENRCLLMLSVGGPGAEVISVKGAGNTVDGGVVEGVEWGQWRRVWST